MTQSIESILSTPTKKQEIEYNNITTKMQGYGDLVNTMAGGGNKKNKQQHKAFIIKKQITIVGEEREKIRAEKRKN